MICCVIPTYRASSTILEVVGQALKYADVVVVIDDACPEQSGERVEENFRGDESVIVIRHTHNRGVGGATKTGISTALELGADVIVKVDADNQMDLRYIPSLARIFEADPLLDYVKGNRFIDMGVVQRMPKLRLLGNSILSLLVKFSSGYWNLLDPTNGYLAFNARKLHEIKWQNLSERYFFEIHVLCMMGIKRARIAEAEMPAIYGDERSSLSISKVVVEFVPKLMKMCLRRVLLQYFIFDVNLGSLYLLLGACLITGAVAFGSFEWAQSFLTNTPRTTGTVMLAVLPFLMGFQLVLNALMYDVQFGLKTIKVIPSKDEPVVTMTDWSRNHVEA